MMNEPDLVDVRPSESTGPSESHSNSELPQCKSEYTSLRSKVQIHDSAASLKKRCTRDTAVIPRQTDLD